MQIQSELPTTDEPERGRTEFDRIPKKDFPVDLGISSSGKSKAFNDAAEKTHLTTRLERDSLLKEREEDIM